MMLVSLPHKEGKRVCKPSFPGTFRANDRRYCSCEYHARESKVEPLVVAGERKLNSGFVIRFHQL